MLWPTLTVGLSLFLVILEVLWLITKDDDYYRSIRFWTKLFILNFGVGVATGLVMEFQFGTNWSRFSIATGGFFGDILGFEGTIAFMLEAGFLGIMVFGWHKVPRGVHLASTILVAFGATLSAFWILVANSWMQTPNGGSFVNGKFVLTNYVAALFNEDMRFATPHMWIACVEASAFVIGGVSAWYILRNRHVALFSKSFRVALVLAIVTTPLQIFIGDSMGLSLEKTQPAKVAAMEAHWNTNPPGKGAPWAVVAWPDAKAQKNSFEILVPDALSYLITRTRTGQVQGLKAFPANDRPPVLIPFYAFRVMVAIGFFLALVMFLTAVQWIRRRLTTDLIGGNRRLLYAWLFSLPLGYLAVETGWLTREVGRQPWVIYHFMRTEDAFSPLPPAAVAFSLAVILIVYLLLLFMFLVASARIIRKGPPSDTWEDEERSALSDPQADS